MWRPVSGKEYELIFCFLYGATGSVEGFLKNLSEFITKGERKKFLKAEIT